MYNLRLDTVYLLIATVVFSTIVISFLENMDKRATLVDACVTTIAASVLFTISYFRSKKP
jgi:nicotinamide riboside transporter PnuC